MIQINKRWGIRSNNNAICLCKSMMVKGVKEWRDCYYYTDVSSALQKLVDMSIMQGLNQGSWEAVISELDRVRAEISVIKDILNREV